MDEFWGILAAIACFLFVGAVVLADFIAIGTWGMVGSRWEIIYIVPANIAVIYGIYNFIHTAIAEKWWIEKK